MNASSETATPQNASPGKPSVKVQEAALPAAASPESGYWAARHLFIAVNGQWLADGAKVLLKELRPGGVLLQDVNLGSRTQTFALVKEIKATVGLGEGLGDLPLMAVQQEVGPYNLLGLENAPSAQALGQNGDPELARKLGQEYGAACVGRGIAIAFAPVLDVFESGAINPGFAVRSFGTEHTLVARVGLAMADGLRQGGVLPVVKHFPGYGAATYGSDGLVVALNKDPAGLSKLLYPFDQAVRRGVPGMLVAHVAVPALDPENPRRSAALSPVLVTELLRTRWDYDGVIIADDVALNPMTRSMGAEQAAVQALAAGCDAVIMLDPDPARIRAVSAAIAAAVARGTLSKDKLQQSVARLTRWQEAIGNLNPIRETPQVERVAEALPPPITVRPEVTAPSPESSGLPAKAAATDAPKLDLPTQQAQVPPQVETAAAPIPATIPAAVDSSPEQKPADEPVVPTVATPSTKEEKPAEGGATAEETGRSRIEHTVREGDLLSGIAQDYDVSTADLVRWNSLESAQVAPGTKLTVYLGDGAQAAPPVKTEPKPEAAVETKEAKATVPETSNTKTSEAAPVLSEPSGFAGKAVHSVAEGETLAAIAEKYVVSVADIKQWNGLDTDAPKAGTVLTIFLGSEGPPGSATDQTAAPVDTQELPKPEVTTPEPAAAAPAPAAETAEAVPPMPDIETEIYVVQSGDTVSKIARERNTTRETVLRLNGLKDANQIRQGQKLKVPKITP